MSSKKTPIHSVTRKVQSDAAGTDSIPKKITKLQQKNHSTVDLRSSTSDIYNSVANVASPANRTPKLTAKSKSVTSLNAFYTPTSLFRNIGTTPSKQKSLPATPKSLLRKTSTDSSTPECFSKISIETPKRSMVSKSEDANLTKDSSETSNLNVAVRVRPMNAKECKIPSVSNVISVDENQVIVLSGTTADNSAGVVHSFQYDYAFWSCNSQKENYADQRTVFENLALPLVDKAFEGYNACLFAYGQTGSGKSYSMMGIDEDDIEIGPQSEAGIIPRFCQEIFQRMDQLKNQINVEIEVSYFEIYNEKIHDLLAVTSNLLNSNVPSKKAALRVREHPMWGPYVVDLSTHPVDSHTALKNWLAVGNSQRASAATGMNEKSSRSHSIFNIILNLTERNTKNTATMIDGVYQPQQTRRSKISLVDLAGSERVSHTCASGERLREGVSINKSLLTLGKVISALAESKKSGVFVPYRESVLTWLLRENLGGNSRTVMLATISPASIHLDETLATLRYACQARSIVNRVKINEDPHDRQIRELRAEVERLQALQQDYERQNRQSVVAQTRKIIIETSVDESEIDALRQQLNETEQELEKAQRSWRDRLQEAESIRKTEMNLLQRNGLALKMSSTQMQACLMNLAADPMLSGTLLYLLPPGIVKIGRSRPTAFQQPDIVLEGPLVAFNHCTIENRNNLLYIESNNVDFETFVNGELITSRQQIFHGDRVVIGGSHYFRVSNPHCSKKSNDTIVDFQLAHHEILKQQEYRLRKELDVEKEAALQRIESEHAASERKFSEKLATLEMENFRYKCSKEMLETEKSVLERQFVEPKFEYHPPEPSKLVEEIKRIMQHPSDESLHQTQLMVKEATQRCRDMGLNLEFKQSQVADEFGIFKAVVYIIDRDNELIAEWPPARLDVWLGIIRENDVEPQRIFDCVDIDWKENEEENDLNESLNSSRRISLNLTAVKDVILGKKPETLKNLLKSSISKKKKIGGAKKSALNEMISPPKNYQDSQMPPSNRKSGNNTEFETQAQNYLKELRKTTIKFKKLCQQYSNDNENNLQNQIGRESNAISVQHCIEQIEQVNNEIQRLIFDGNLIEPSSRTPKSVRFLLD